jgi:predicted transport protein
MVSGKENNKNPVMVEAGKKAAQVRATATYTFEQHLERKSDTIKSLMHIVREYILGLDSAIEEVPRKYVIAYKISQNIVCMEPQIRNIKLFLKLNADDIESPPKSYRDVTGIGHYGTGNSEFIISNEDEFVKVKPFIELAYNKVGG